MNRDFKGVWIPKEIWLREDLNALEKVILAEIDSLDNENNCVAGNEYFAEFCQCSESKVSKAIKKLKDLGLIEIIAFDGRHRKIRVVKNNIQSSKKYKAESYKKQSNNIANNTINNTNNKNNTKVLLAENSAESNTFLKSSSNPPRKQNKYSKCVSLIHDFTVSEKLIAVLVDYLNMLLEADKSMYTNQFKGKLNKLKQLTDDERDMIVIVEQSIQFGWKSFYPLKKDNYRFNNSGGGFKDNIEGDKRELPPLEECLSDRSF